MNKKLLLVFSILCFCASYLAQSNNTGSINIRIGGNANLGATFKETRLGNLISDEDTSTVLATTIPITIDFGLHKLISVSAGFRSGRWINEDPNDNNIEVKESKTKTFNLGFKFYPISKKNFNLYVGYDFGLSGFSREKYTKNNYTTEKQKWAGTSHYLNIGTNFYFGKGFGMYYQMGYTGYNLDLKEYSISNPLININPLDNNNLSVNSIVKGFQVELGFCFKFGNAEN